MAVPLGRQALIQHRSTQVAQSPTLATVLGFFVVARLLSELFGAGEIRDKKWPIGSPKVASLQ